MRECQTPHWNGAMDQGIAWHHGAYFAQMEQYRTELTYMYVLGGIRTRALRRRNEI